MGSTLPAASDTVAVMTATVAASFLESADVAAQLVGHPNVAAMWHEPSALHEYTVGALAAHLGRAVTTVERYRDTDAPSRTAPLLNAVEYFARALGDHDPISSDVHIAVRRRAEKAADAGPGPVAADVRDTVARLVVSGLDPNVHVAVFDGMAMRLGDYLRTRIVELVVHTSDLARSVNVPEPALPAGAWAIAADVVAALALHRQGARGLTLGLARSDAFPPPTAF